MKICPNCGLQAQLDAARCNGCGHLYRTKFTAQQTQVVPLHVPTAPPAPIPPKWWQHFIPGVSEAYRAELLRHQAELAVYLEVNRLITPAMKKRAAFFTTIVGLVIFLTLVWIVVDLILWSRATDFEMERLINEVNVETERSMRQGEAEAQLILRQSGN